MKEKILMILFVIVLGSLLTGTLVLVDSYTAPIIEKNEIVKLRTSVLGAMGIPYKELDVNEVFQKNIEVLEKGDEKVYVSKQGDVAFEFLGSGLWGPIQGILAVLSDLETIKGITIVHQEETPGLGGRIAEKEFLDKFKNKKVMPVIKILTPGKAKEDNEVDGITGATMSASAFEKILNSQSKKYLSLINPVRNGAPQSGISNRVKENR